MLAMRGGRCGGRRSACVMWWLVWLERGIASLSASVAQVIEFYETLMECLALFWLASGHLDSDGSDSLPS